MNRKIIYLKAVLLILIFSVSTYLTFKYQLWQFFSDKNQIISFINKYKTLSVFIFIGLQILQVTIAFIPGEVTGFIGGYLFGVILGTFYSTIGLTLGSMVAFSLARFFGRPFVLLFVNRKYLEKFDYLMTHRGTAISAILFLMPGFPKDYLCYILGLSNMRLRVFFIISTFGRLVSTYLLSVAGTLIRNEYYKSFITLAVLVGIIMLIIYIYKDPLEKKIHSLLHKDD
ncbi:MAG: TVP38/TMEM64 family protein [Proteobacteria bacterium]|nr:TVP38/TMEM64 family protein [Pseudomonadota bacterium]